MADEVQVYPLDVKRDDRGWLTEILRASHNRPDESISQLYVTVAHPGKTKGRHYHERKVEWFCVVSGEGTLALQNTHTGKSWSVAMGEKNMVTVRIPPHIAHAITNTGNTPLFLVVMVSEEFNPEDPDTYPFQFANP
jgi:UDP-2-acetamido-2,6-beta-L-arabino-hexul-4-ose reductase